MQKAAQRANVSDGEGPASDTGRADLLEHRQDGLTSRVRSQDQNQAPAVRRTPGAALR